MVPLTQQAQQLLLWSAKTAKGDPYSVHLPHADLAVNHDDVHPEPHAIEPRATDCCTDT